MVKYLLSLFTAVILCGAVNAQTYEMRTDGSSAVGGTLSISDDGLTAGVVSTDTTFQWTGALVTQPGANPSKYAFGPFTLTIVSDSVHDDHCYATRRREHLGHLDPGAMT